MSAQPGNQTPLDIYGKLERATPHERAEIVLELIHQHPDGKLELPARGAFYADLSWIELYRADLGKANLLGANLINAQLEGANLQAANLQGAQLQNANLKNANFQGAQLQNANLKNANLLGTQLQGVDLQGAQLHWAQLQGVDFYGAKLQNANLQGAQLQGAQLGGIQLQGVDLQGAQLQGAQLRAARLQGAQLQYANLQGAQLRYANLQAANLQNAKLQGVDLADCVLSHIFVNRTWLDKTRLWREQLGGEIGEELEAANKQKDVKERARLYRDAEQGYLILKQNFDGLGDYHAASWAYRKERRMRKLASLQEARAGLKRREWRSGLRHSRKYFTDQCVAEWLCDYGESVERVVLAIVVVFIAFSLLYGFNGAVTRNGTVVCQLAAWPLTCDWLSLAHFSLGAMSTMGVSGLDARYTWVDVVLRLQAMLSVTLFGLLGFVVGNRIRRS